MLRIRTVLQGIRPPVDAASGEAWTERLQRFVMWMPAVAVIAAGAVALALLADQRTDPPPPHVLRTVDLPIVDVPPRLIDINTATASELETLPGVGASRAEAIIELRSAEAFTSLADLVERGVLRPSELLAIQEVAAVYALAYD